MSVFLNPPNLLREIVSSPVRILIAEPDGMTPGVPDLLTEALNAEVVVGAVADPTMWFQDFDVVWLRLANRIGPDQLGAIPRCRLLATATTGLDHLDLKACAERGVAVVSLRGETGLLREVRATAELTIGLMLATYRNLVPAASSVIGGDWDRDRFRGRELHGSTVGVVGLGRLGSIVTRYLDAFGAKVIASDPAMGQVPPGVAATLVTMDELLEASDIVTIHVPYAAGQGPLLGEREFAMMKPGSVLVNTSRGGCIDEAALIGALDDGRLAGAALDVLQGEPDISSDHPLVRYAAQHPEVTIVPHIGGNTAESVAKTERFIAQRIIDLVESSTS